VISKFRCIYRIISDAAGDPLAVGVLAAAAVAAGGLYALFGASANEAAASRTFRPPSG